MMENESQAIIGVSRKNLFAALAKAQGQIEAAHKGTVNPFFKSKFADLAECIYVTQKPASENGLSLIFDFKTEILGDNPVFWIRYILSHSSGEAFHSQWVVMLMSKKDAQGFAAACTYYKRQLMKAVYMIPEIDDDAESITGHQTQPAPQGGTQGLKTTTSQGNVNNAARAPQNATPIRVPVTK